jgi:hypothetical protein
MTALISSVSNRFVSAVNDYQGCMYRGAKQQKCTRRMCVLENEVHDSQETS